MSKDARPRMSPSSSELSGKSFRNGDDVDVESQQELAADGSHAIHSAVAETEADAHSACGCDCGAALSKPELSEVFSVQCECTFCGPCDGLGNRRCSIALSPVILMATALERGMKTLTEIQPCYCGDCREFCVLQIRIAAVKRARNKRMCYSSSDVVMPQPDADNERSLQI